MEFLFNRGSVGIGVAGQHTSVFVDWREWDDIVGLVNAVKN